MTADEPPPIPPAGLRANADDDPGERPTGGSFAGHRLREDATGEVFLIERSVTWWFTTGTTGAAFITRHGVPGYLVPFEAISLHVPEGEKGWTLLPPLPGRDNRSEEADHVGGRHP